jgi:metacaspase-1
MQIYGRVLALTLCVVPVVVASAAKAGDRALVVGVNEYPGITSGGTPGGANLSGAVPDAETFVKLLVDVFKFEPGAIKLLTNKQATKANILDGFQDWLTAGSQPNDRVVFYFAGHGATAAVEDALANKRLTSTIVPSDAQGDLDRPGAKIVGMIEGKTIGALLARLDGRHVMVVADSCQSGSLTRGLTGGLTAGARARTISEHVPVGMDPGDVTRGIQIEAKTDNRLVDLEALSSGPRDVAVWSAATIQQVTFDLPDGSGGIFTQSFAKGLRDKRAAREPDGEVTAGNLLQYVRDRTNEFCKTQPGCRSGLTPELLSPPNYLTSVLNPFGAARAASAPTGPQIVYDATNLFSHNNDFALTAEILPSARVRQGETVRFRITSGAPGKLVVIDIGPDGNATQIFPNKRSELMNKGGHIRSGGPLTFPDASYGFVFTASRPGRGTLLVLVAEEDVELSEYLVRNLNFKPMSQPRAVITEIAEKLNTPKITNDLEVPNGSRHWAFITTPYEVLP